MTFVLLSLGSNLEPVKHLHAAILALYEQFGELTISPTYRMTAVGFEGPAFLNNAVGIMTDLDVFELDQWLHQLENKHGRDRTQPRYSDRTLDIDIVFYGELITEGDNNLKIPRPELKHAFVLKPMSDIAPKFIDPISKKSLITLWQQHPDYNSKFDIVIL